MDYNKDLTIDGEALDQEWLVQPSLMKKYTKHAALMKKELEVAKQNLDIAKADADQRIRRRPAKYGLSKITEGAVSAAILSEEGYQEAYSAFLEAKYEADMASGAVTAFEHRKSALENLVKLYGQQYFAGPVVPYQINREWQGKQTAEKVNNKVGEKWGEIQRTRK